MNVDIRNLFLVVFFALNRSIAFGQAYKETLHVQLPDSLDFINIAGKPTAYYELYLTNFSTDTFQIKKLSILNMDNSSLLFSMQNRELKKSYSKIGSIMKDTTMELMPGNSAVMYVQLSFGEKQIKEIVHRISFEGAGKEDSGEISVQTPATKCFLNAPLMLGAPLKGGFWTAVYGPYWESGHRRVIYTANGKARIPGRYAIDFIEIDSNGKYSNGDENTINNWLGYGADVLSVADGIVSSVRDDFPESLTLSGHPEYSTDKATGNYVSIKIGSNQFAFYEHLKHQSIKVKIGQKVKKGDVIASLGFTGQTTGPHLHFHIANADSPLVAEGIPFVFGQFELLGSYEDLENFGKARWTPLNGSNKLTLIKERPQPNAVIKFKPD